MPTTRRRSSGAAVPRSKAKTQNSQSKLAFHGQTNKVTKSTSESTGKPAKQIKDTTRVEEPIAVESPSLSHLNLEEATTSADSSLVEDEVALAQEEPADPNEELARKVKESQIKQYWIEKEHAMGAPRVHQEGLGLHEKVLKQWDTDNSYGPCIGITRTKRWKRASNLGLNPPIEVLSILLQGKNSERAQLDELMASRFSG